MSPQGFITRLQDGWLGDKRLLSRRGCIRMPVRGYPWLGLPSHAYMITLSRASTVGMIVRAVDSRASSAWAEAWQSFGRTLLPYF